MDTPHKTIDVENPMLAKGTTFQDVGHFRLSLKQYCITHECEVKMLKSELRRVTAVCADPKCEWRVHASRMLHTEMFMVKKITDKHTCSSANKRCNAMAEKRWIASKISPWVKKNWRLTPKELSSRLQERYHVTLPYLRIWRSRKIAMEEIHGSWGDLFSLIPNFVMEVNTRNPGSNCHYELESDNSFKRVYMCLKPCVDGFLEGCRPIIGLDGCHLKTKFNGVCLSATTIDGNYKLFPLAFAVVDSESSSSWNWFMSSLRTSLGALPDLTFMSDRHKGLEDAVHRQLPESEHCTCMRHLYANFKKKFGRQHLLNVVWEAVEAYTTTEFDDLMRVLKIQSVEAYNWFTHLDVKKCLWERSKFSEYAKCNYITNNFNESLNSWMGDTRYKPIVLLLDDLRQKMMYNLYKKRCEASTWTDRLVPYARKHIMSITRGQGHHDVTKSNDFEAEVADVGTRCAVNLLNHTCTCRVWQVTGFPCTHAAAFLTIVRGVLWEDYVVDFYTTERYKNAYKYSIGAMPEKEYWGTSMVEVRPPRVVRQSGRPQVVRRKSILEELSTRMVKCRKCGKLGHTIRTYTEEASTSDGSSRSVLGRPTTVQPSQPTQESMVQLLRDVTR